MGQAKAIVDRFWALFESGDFDSMRRLMTADSETTLPGGVRVEGPDQTIGFLQAYREAFPDMRHDAINYIEEGDQIAVQLHITATQTGTFRTPMGDVPPSGRSLVLDSCDIVKISGGKIASWQVYFDQVAMLSQIGLMPAPASA